MKILRYLIFLSILSGIFFVIYRQSDEKGFRRWWTSFKIAVLIAASAAGLIPANTEAMEPPGNNNQVYQERLLSEVKSLIRLKTMMDKLFWLKQVIVHLQFRLHLDEGSRVISRHHLLGVNLVGLYMYQNTVQRPK